MGTNLLFAVTSAYLLVYYTNYAQINPAIVGTIMLSSKIFDAVSDVAMGYIEERFAKPHAKSASVDQTNGSSICGISITFICGPGI